MPAKPICTILKQQFSILPFLLAAITVATWASTLFLYFLQGNMVARRKLALALIIWLFLLVLLAPAIRRVFLPQLRRLGTRRCQFAAIFSLVAGFLFIPAFPLYVPPNLVLVPRHHLEIIATGEKVPESTGTVVEILGFDTGVTLNSVDTLQMKGDWQRSESGIVFIGSGKGHLTWTGFTHENTNVLFNSRPDGGIVEVTWDGIHQPIDLYSPSPTVVYVHQELPFPPIVRTSSVLLIGLTFSSLVFILLVALASSPSRRQLPHTHGRGWILLSMPMIVAWCLYLLAFWPGIMALDSTNQWMQLITGHYSDLHPLAHTLTLWLVTRLWFSPASVALFQVGALSLLIASGLRMLEKFSLPRSASWLVSSLFALSPVMGSLSITLLKDVLFSTAFLTLVLIILYVTLDRYCWLGQGVNWVLPGLAAAAVALYRHNGFPVALGTLVLLSAFSWRTTRKGLLSLLLMAGLWLGVRQIALWATKAESGLVMADTPILHHLGAHVSAGTPLTPEEHTYLDSVLPLDAPWPYRCLSVNSLQNHPDFNLKFFRSNPRTNWRIFLDLLQRDPGVDINHWLCSSNLVWKIRKVDSYMYSDSLVLKEDDIQWIEPGPYSPRQASRLPGLIPLFTWLIKAPQNNINIEALIWRPATYLYLHLFCTAVLALRLRSTRLLLFAFPALLQSALLFIGNIAQDFRYQFAVYMLGLFSIALLFLRPQVNDQASGPLLQENSGASKILPE